MARTESLALQKETQRAWTEPSALEELRYLSARPRLMEGYGRILNCTCPTYYNHIE